MKLLALMMVVAACGDDSMMMMVQPDAGDPPQPDAPATPHVTVGGTIFDLDIGKPLTPASQNVLPGVEVCSLVTDEAKTCVTTDAQGRWALSLPAQRKGIGITMTLAGYSPLFNVTATLANDETWGDMYLGRNADMAAFAAATGGLTYPVSTTSAWVALNGHRHIAPNFPNLDGGTMSANAGNGAFYFSAPWQYDANQTTTTTAGYGYGVFGDIPVTLGSVDVTIKLAGTTCFASRQMVPLVGEDTIRVPVLAGFITHLPTVCE